MPALGINTVVAYLFGFILLFILGWVLLTPLKMFLKLVYNGILGGLILVFINLVGNLWGVTIGINPITAVVTGLLGIPGVVLMFLTKSIFNT